MKTLQIFDPAMCCSTGVCGPSVDQNLVKLAADVAFLKSRGITVERFNLGHQPEAFASNSLVLQEMGPEAENLPLFIIDGVVKAKAMYPNRYELSSWLELDQKPVEKIGLTDLTMFAHQCCEDPSKDC